MKRNAPGGRSEKYLDAQAFARLFDDRIKNRDAIWVQLQLIALHVASGLRIDRDRIDDAVSEATLYAVRQLGKYDAGKGTSAFSYFTSVVGNALRKYRQHEDSQRCHSWDDFLRARREE